MEKKKHPRDLIMNYEGKLRSTAGITDGFSRWESRVGGVGNGNIKKSNCNLQPSGGDICQ